MSTSRKFYFYSLFFIYSAYIFTYLGVINYLPKYVYLFHGITQLLLCLFLLYKYHPFKTFYKYTKYDEQLIFSAALLLLINLLGLPVIYTQHSKQELQSIIHNIL